MLKKMSIRKIMVASLSLVALFLVYLMPSNTENLNIEKTSIEYLYTNEVEVVYLLDSNDYVSRTTIKKNGDNVLETAHDIISALTIDGNRSDIIPNGFKAIIPSGTEILDINIADDLITVDLSRDVLMINALYEEKMIESIIYSLTNIEGIDKVKLLVEGDNFSKLPNSGKTLPLILDRSYGINKNYDLINTNNIESYTVYYVSKINDDSYYVPVTKYINSKGEDKIKVIIEELSTSPIYEDNLMSFLNAEVSLINYNIENDILNLNFNNSIFMDRGSSEILEEVIYTIGLSCIDNYEVTDVSISVENKQIYKNLSKILE